MRMNGETTLSTIPKPERTVRAVRKAGGSGLDWEALRRKILESSARLAWIDDVPQEILDQTLAQRASLMAQVVETGDTGEQLQVVVIRLGQEVYGLETDHVFDIRSLESLTRVPRVPDWVAGVVNLRGRIISVLDLQRFLGLPLTHTNTLHEPGSQHLVMVGTPAMELAILVDEVIAIEALPTNQIQEASGTVRGIPAEFMRGIFVRSHSDSEALPRLILDLPGLLADKRLIVHEDII